TVTGVQTCALPILLSEPHQGVLGVAAVFRAIARAGIDVELRAMGRRFYAAARGAGVQLHELERRVRRVRSAGPGVVLLLLSLVPRPPGGSSARQCRRDRVV